MVVPLPAGVVDLDTEAAVVVLPAAVVVVPLVEFVAADLVGLVDILVELQVVIQVPELLPVLLFSGLP